MTHVDVKVVSTLDDELYVNVISSAGVEVVEDCISVTRGRLSLGNRHIAFAVLVLRDPRREILLHHSDAEARQVR